MAKLMRYLIPQKLKYRLFMAFVCVVLLPFCALNLYNYQRIETLVQQKISQQSHYQLEQMYRTLEDQISIAFKTLIFLKQDDTVKSVLRSPEQRDELENKRVMESIFMNLNNSFFLYNPSVYFMILDLNESAYTSYRPRKALVYGELRSLPGFDQQAMNAGSYHWVPNDPNYVQRDVSTSTYLLSLYASLNDSQNKPYGLARISIDYSSWLRSIHNQSDLQQQYFLMTREGEDISQSVPDTVLPEQVKAEIAKQPDRQYFIDKASNSLINYIYVESLDWYIVNRIPLPILYNEIEGLKRQYFTMFFMLMGAFLVMTFVIASTITRPLSRLQDKIKSVVRKNLKIRLPEQKFSGEILELTRTFNVMLDDMDVLIQRLKTEERQKEAVHFHMLLAQMNPHFLLNTLNTIKWSAIRQGNDDITDISLSLGKLLEASLNTEKDLVHLQDEIELVQAYVHIQQIRHNRRFEVIYRYDEDIVFALVPKLSLQPLVENAILHGVSHLAEKGLIQIRVWREEAAKLVVEIEDNGIGMARSAQMRRTRTRPGIGLDNVRERLRLLFKNDGRMDVISSDRGTRVRFTIPFLLATPYGRDQDQDRDRGSAGEADLPALPPGGISAT
ncbi:histidine kinase [Paenibacillus macerans]|nr:sensor histidine kinase [Paenibacillus macerans]MCY7562072.1 histidine kinase [Paenibacillus macerans]MEC0137571.1 histidine kinase [Paenibacillus macerans]MEC0153837.1 histidine kinase [Paenibacillus macerans]SUA86334.1 integral membrane sensor signal transduction histidine kinase [Paenibacillus macerans]GBK66031.1 two-component sensor histidine kinase [Paenibacillus macerans]